MVKEKIIQISRNSIAKNRKPINRVLLAFYKGILFDIEQRLFNIEHKKWGK